MASISTIMCGLALIKVLTIKFFYTLYSEANHGGCSSVGMQVHYKCVHCIVHTVPDQFRSIRYPILTRVEALHQFLLSKKDTSVSGGYLNNVVKKAVHSLIYGLYNII